MKLFLYLFDLCFRKTWSNESWRWWTPSRPLFTVDSRLPSLIYSVVISSKQTSKARKHNLNSFLEQKSFEQYCIIVCYILVYVLSKVVVHMGGWIQSMQGYYYSLTNTRTQGAADWLFVFTGSFIMLAHFIFILRLTSVGDYFCKIHHNISIEDKIPPLLYLSNCLTDGAFK